TFLHLFSVIKSIGFTLILMDYIKGLGVLVLSGLFAAYANKYFFLSYGLLSRTIILISLVILVYSLFVFAFKLIKKEELASFPIINKWVS
ncbi:MAG TPA: stage V sporulation protein B, partial [Sporolactobacillaceae bacterium]|nr:stage V sporulation protein B [Sporolactobacillaceae bacterium]